MRTTTRPTLSVLLLGLFACANATAQATDPAAAATPLRYESAFTDFRAQPDTSALPWKQLFTADGAFADVSATQATPAMAMEKPTAVAPTQLTQNQSKPTTSSDTRGRIESINKQTNKVKLKHEAIPKFDMPGMTMVFRVQDPKLLEQIKVGDEVGVNMDQIGGSLVITGFQK